MRYLEGFKMKYIKFGTYTGAENMQIDSDLLEEAIETQAQEPVFRLYAWKPRCISLGRNQKDEFLHAKFLHEYLMNNNLYSPTNEDMHEQKYWKIHKKYYTS